MTRIKNALKNLQSRDSGSASVLGGGGLITVIVIVLLIILIF